MGMQDFVTDFWRTPTLNVTWWFMSTIILCYIFFPIIKKIAERKPIILLAIWIAITVYSPVAVHRQFKTGCIFYFGYFCLGIFFSQKKIFEWLKNVRMKRYLEVGVAIIFLILTFWLRLKDRYLLDWTYTLAIMWFVEAVIVRSGAERIKKFLIFLGKHSSNIFMMHTFFMMIYWQDFIYSFRYPILIYSVLLICSVVTSIIIEKFKEVVGIYRLQARI